MTKVILKPLNPNDYRAWFEGYDNRLPSQHAFDEGHLDMSMCDQEWFDNLVAHHQQFADKDEQYIFGIFDQESGQHVGMFNLAVLARDNFQWAEIGYSIHNQFWLNGYAFAALQSFQKMNAKEDYLGFHRVEAHVSLENQASKNLLAKSGFYQEGIRKRFIKEDQDWIDKAIFVWLDERQA